MTLRSFPLSYGELWKVITHLSCIYGVVYHVANDLYVMLYQMSVSFPGRLLTIYMFMSVSSLQLIML